MANRLIAQRGLILVVDVKPQSAGELSLVVRQSYAVGGIGRGRGDGCCGSWIGRGSHGDRLVWYLEVVKVGKRGNS